MMLEHLLVYGIPLIAVFALRHLEFHKAWNFFFSTLLAFVITISMLPYTLPLAKYLLGDADIVLYFCVFFICGAVLTILFYLPSALLIRKKKFTFPEKYLRIPKFFLLYAGSLLQIILLTFGCALLLERIKPGMPAKLLIAGNRIVPFTMFVSKCDMSERQIQWLRHVPAKRCSFILDEEIKYKNNLEKKLDFE